MQYPVGESNPCLRRERAVSWATRRTGQVETEIVCCLLSVVNCAVAGSRFVRKATRRLGEAPGSRFFRKATSRLTYCCDCYDVIPLVSVMNAVSRLISSSLNRVRAWPFSTNSRDNRL